VHPRTAVEAALELGGRGLNATEVGRKLGIPRGTVRDWLAGSAPHHAHGPHGCDRCGSAHDLTLLGQSYVYLLGLYLGDGSIATHRRAVYRLRIVLDIKYPGIIDSAAEAMCAVRHGRVNTQLRRDNCVEVSSYWKCWPCLFPQHGPGPKHARSIALTDWQTELVGCWPEQLLRGLIHSDGCRFTNTGRCNWVCPRYSFTQVSEDIKSIFCEACDLMGLHWTRSGERVIYVSRKADVATLDRFIGPKR